MRIALITYSTRPRGGVVHTLALAEALAARGHEVRVHTLGRGEDRTFFRTVDPAVQVVVAPLPDLPGETVGERVERSIAALRASLDLSGLDVVHAQDCISANAAGTCIRTVHHLDDFTTPQLVACHEAAIRRPFAHVCVSQAVADELAATRGIEATVIPNGVHAARFAAAASDEAAAVTARARWRGELGPDPWVLAVGGIEPRKGTLELVEAVALLRRTHPSVRLVVAGGETLFDYRAYRAEVLARAAALGVSPLVLGPVDDARLPALVAESDAFAFPSTKEGFGLAAMEALAAGVPVVTRDLPVLREVFGDAATFGSDPASLATALADALEAPDPTRAGRGQALAAAHTWAAAAKAHERLYEEQLARL
jgi:glycosyltransferase-like protein